MMELPTARELELETLLRTRDRQLAELTDEVTHLRKSLNTQTTNLAEDSVTLPPAIVSVLLPHLRTGPTPAGLDSSHGTVATALIQKARHLQEENDELYDLLKQGETGKLKEEVRGLRRLVEKLEGALRESHQVITTLSAELDKTYDTFMSSARPTLKSNDTRSYSRSPSNSYHPLPPTHSGDPSKLPPTGPRAHKKPRLSDVQSPPKSSRPNGPGASSQHRPSGSASYNGARASDSQNFKAQRGRSDLRGKPSNHNKMDVEEETTVRPPSPRPDRGRPGDVDWDRGRDRDRERGGGERNRPEPGAGSGRERNHRDRGDRERHKPQRRNGHHEGRGQNRGNPPRRHERGQTSVTSNDATAGDRTLAERMGL